MLENGYPFGAIINKNMMNDDYQRTNWPVLFNYGVAENEMKWRSCCNKDQAVQVLGFSRSRSSNDHRRSQNDHSEIIILNTIKTLEFYTDGPQPEKIVPDGKY